MTQPANKRQIPSPSNAHALVGGKAKYARVFFRNKYPLPNHDTPYQEALRMLVLHCGFLLDEAFKDLDDLIRRIDAAEMIDMSQTDSPSEYLKATDEERTATVTSNDKD